MKICDNHDHKHFRHAIYADGIEMWECFDCEITWKAHPNAAMLRCSKHRLKLYPLVRPNEVLWICKKCSPDLYEYRSKEIRKGRNARHYSRKIKTVFS